MVLTGILDGMRNDRRHRRGGAVSPRPVHRVLGNSDQFHAGACGRGLDPVQRGGRMETGVIADPFAVPAIRLDPSGEALVHQVGIFEDVAVDLVSHLQRVATVDEDSGPVLHHDGGACRTGKARRPEQALIAVGQVLVVVLVFVRDQEAVKAELGEGGADLRNVVAAVLRAALHVEGLGNHLGHGAEGMPATVRVQSLS